MTTPRGFRDRADDSLFTLLGDIPELVRNLVVAEINGAKAWAQRTAKDAGIGAGWVVGALIGRVLPAILDGEGPPCPPAAPSGTHRGSRAQGLKAQGSRLRAGQPSRF